MMIFAGGPDKNRYCQESRHRDSASRPFIPVSGRTVCWSSNAQRLLKPASNAGFSLYKNHLTIALKVTVFHVAFRLLFQNEPIILICNGLDLFYLIQIVIFFADRTSHIITSIVYGFYQQIWRGIGIPTAADKSRTIVSSQNALDIGVPVAFAIFLFIGVQRLVCQTIRVVSCLDNLFLYLKVLLFLVYVLRV